MRASRPRQNRFTCIEIMMVVLVLGLLATIVTESLRGANDKAKRTKAEADIGELQTALDYYYRDNGYYPTTDQGLRALVTLPTTGYRSPRLFQRRLYRAPSERPVGESLFLSKRWEFVRPE